MFKKPPILHSCVSLYLIRNNKTRNQALGTCICIDDLFVTHFIFNTLEIPSNPNKNDIFYLSPGSYKCVCAYSPEHGRHISIRDKTNRLIILMRAGHFVYQKKECVLVGNRFRDIDQDNNFDVCNSLETMYMLWFTMSKNFTLIIY